MMDHDFLEPERLRAFVAVAEAGNFTRAAERLHLTQPTVSMQVRRLEENIGRPLFERNAQFVRLTADGEAMLGYARELLEVLGRARRQFAQPQLEGSVRFGMVEEFGITALPFLLARLRREHPHFELTIETGLGPDLLQRLAAGSVDLVLTKRTAGQNQGTSLCRQKLVWVGQPGVIEPGNDIVPLVLFPSQSISREIILRTLREHGLRWSIRFESASIASLRAAVLAGLGVAVFGVGMIPNGVNVLPPSLLPELADAEYLLDWRPDCTDRVVVAFGSILRLTAPLIIQRLVDDQTPLVLAAGDPEQQNYRASDTLQMY
jgi:DNA-binding transcriptional LysR family regulator